MYLLKNGENCAIHSLLELYKSIQTRCLILFHLNLQNQIDYY